MWLCKDTLFHLFLTRVCSPPQCLQSSYTTGGCLLAIQAICLESVILSVLKSCGHNQEERISNISRQFWLSARRGFNQKIAVKSWLLWVMCLIRSFPGNGLSYLMEGSNSCCFGGLVMKASNWQERGLTFYPFSSIFILSKRRPFLQEIVDLHMTLSQGILL